MKVLQFQKPFFLILFLVAGGTANAVNFFRFLQKKDGRCSDALAKVSEEINGIPQSSKSLLHVHGDQAQAELLADMPWAAKLRLDLNEYQRRDPNASLSDFERWSRATSVHPSIKKEVLALRDFIEEEMKSLRQLEALGLLNGTSSRIDMSRHPRLTSFKVALEKLKERNSARMEMNFMTAEEAWAAEEKFWGQLNAWIRNIPTNLRDFASLRSEVQKLEEAQTITVHDFLRVSSSYLNIYNREPEAAYEGNRYYPTHYEPQQFAKNQLLMETILFPHIMYFPTTTGMTLEKLNDLFVTGIMPAELIRGGSVIRADDGTFTSPLAFAGHDVSHVPTTKEKFYSSGNKPDFERNLGMAIHRLKFKGKTKSLPLLERKRMEFIYFVVLHEHAVDPRSNLSPQVDSLAKLMLDPLHNQNEILKENQFKSLVEAKEWATRFLQILKQ
jgi:hypothetical protein